MAKRTTGITDLTVICNKIIADLGIGPNIGALINGYCHRKKIENVNALKVEKSRVLNTIDKPNMSWGTFRHIIFDIVNPSRLTISFKFETDNGKSKTVTYIIDNRRKDEDTE